MTAGGSGSQAAGGVLEGNRAFFESAAGAACASAARGDIELAMQWAKLAAECAWVMHPGFYTHPPLEAMLGSLAEALPKQGPEAAPLLPQKEGKGKRWLHLLTSANMIGGHTRLAERMIARASQLSADIHSVLLIDQGGQPVPQWLARAARATGGGLVTLPEGSGLAGRARLVRQAALQWADTVVLHVHPSDPVPAVALGVAARPKVVLVNHADHVFWLGTWCCDAVCEIRQEGAELTRSRRGALPSVVLPIPLELPAHPEPRDEARAALGIAPEQVALVAIASSYKFAPRGGHDFPALATELLRRHDNAVLLLVGPAHDDPFFRDAARACGARLRLLGIQPDVARFYAAADICLESFPFGSLTSTLDAMLLGTPVVRAPKGIPLFFLGAYPGLVEAARDGEEYLRQVGRYVADPTLRRAAGEAQKQGVVEAHAGTGWRSAWETLQALLREGSSRAEDGAVTAWDSPGELDLRWVELQQRQGTVAPDPETFYKHRVRSVMKGRSRKSALNLWLSALRQGDLKLARILLRNLTQRI